LDLERFRLPPAMRGELEVLQLAPPHPQVSETFIRGPIPFVWLAEASRSGDAGFRLAVGVWYLARRYGRPAIQSVPELAAVLETSPRTVERGLRAVRGRLVEAVGAGRKTAWAERKRPEDRIDAWALRGPIPWSWWAAASRLPNPSLRVGAVCWIVSGQERSAEFVLGSGRWTEWGLSRFAVSRGLRTLAQAGLVSVDHRPGRPPMVTLCEPGNVQAGRRSEA
jgi:hypothetical protein